MSLLTRLNAKFGRYGVANLTLLLIGGQVLLYVAQQINPGPHGIDVLQSIELNPQKVMAGEVWRVATFLFIPPTTNLIFAFFFWYLFYLMGTTLEATWGAFRYNVFLGIGYLASIAFAFGVYFIVGPEVATMTASNAFLYGTVFLAFARLYPEFTMLIFFVLPVKIRWLALVAWIGYGFNFLVGDWMTKAMIVASVANYLLFFGREIWLDVKHGHRRMLQQTRAIKSPTKLVHKCRTCGITNETAPQMQFRYCSKCDGEACYCAEHLGTHEHVAPQVAVAGQGDSS